MTIDEVMAYYGTAYYLEKKTGISHNTVTNWKRIGYIPIITQMKIESLTLGKLEASLSHVKKEDIFNGNKAEQVNDGVF